MSAISVSSLRKTYPGKPPVDAVRGVDLKVHPGECFGVLGPNGAGKTTTIEILEGLLKPTSGDVEILGKSWVTDGDAIRQAIGISLQETQLADKLTVLETVTLFRSFYRSGIEPTDAIRRVGLEDKSGTWIKNLSGGQKQRVAVATAIVGNPELLFMDEPTTGLDPRSRRDLWDILTEYKAGGGTILLTTHYMDEAERLCDRVAIFDHGLVLAVDTPRRLISDLQGDHVVEFRVAGRVDDPQSLGAVEGVASVRKEDDCYCLSVAEPHRVIPRLLAHLESRSLPLESLTTRQASLEDVFVQLTGRHLDDEEERTVQGPGSRVGSHS